MYSNHVQDTARGPGPARDPILSGPRDVPKLYDVVELPHSLQDRIATCITLTLTLTVKLTRTLNLTLQLTLTLTHLDPTYSLTMHKSNHNNFPREADR